MKIIRNMLVLASLCLCVNGFAQEKVGKKIKEDIKQNTTFGGYIVGRATASTLDNIDSHVNMDLRYTRLYVDGKVLDFKYKLQVEMVGTPRILDAWAEWQRYKFFQVRFGQFKRAFTFENPMNPWNIGFGAYSQLTSKLAGMSDRIGEHSSGGRDMGVQVQGDLIPIGSDKHNLLHYQVGLYNGQGINQKDVNRHKDLIGGLFFYPIKNLAIAAFGWNGRYTKNGIDADRKRLSFGVNYESDWTVRAEYAMSKGQKIGATSLTGSDKADAWYIAVGAPVTKKCKIYAKWDVLRDAKTWDSANSIYALSANYYFYKNFKLQANYNFIHNKQAADPNYHTVDLQVYWRF